MCDGLSLVSGIRFESRPRVSVFALLAGTPCPVLTCCQQSADLSILEPSAAAPCSQSKQGREAFSAELHAQREKPEPGWITHTASWSLEDGCSAERRGSLQRRTKNKHAAQRRPGRSSTADPAAPFRSEIQSGLKSELKSRE